MIIKIMESQGDLSNRFQNRAKKIPAIFPRERFLQNVYCDTL